MVTGSSSENCVKELSVRPEAVPLPSQFLPGNYTFSHSHSLTHSLVETEEIDEGQGDLELQG